MATGLKVTLQDLRDDLRVRIRELSPDRLPSKILDNWLNWGQYQIALKMTALTDVWLGKVANLSVPLGTTGALYKTGLTYTHSTGVISGLSGLTVDQYIGRWIAIDGTTVDATRRVLYDLIADNDATTLTVLKFGGMAQNATVKIVVFSGDPRQSPVIPGLPPHPVKTYSTPTDCMKIRKITDGTNLLPFYRDLKDLEGVFSNTYFDSQVVAAQFGPYVMLFKGASASYPATVTCWYYQRPNELSADTDELGWHKGRIPIELSDLVVMAGEIKARGALQQRSEEVEAQIEGLYTSIESGLSGAIALQKAQAT